MDKPRQQNVLNKSTPLVQKAATVFKAPFSKAASVNNKNSPLTAVKQEEKSTTQKPQQAQPQQKPAQAAPAHDPKKSK